MPETARSPIVSASPGERARPLRVLHVTGGRVFGGIETYLAALAAVDVAEVRHVFALAFPGRLHDRLAAAGADAEVFGDVALRASRPYTVIAARRRLAAVIDAHRPDVVLVHGPWSYALFGGIARRRAPTVLMAHGQVRRRWPDLWPVVRPPRGVIANSAWTLGEARRAWRTVPMRVVHPAVVAPARLEDRSALRHALGASAHDVVLVMVSRIDALKGHEVLLRAMARLDTTTGWRAWLVGGAQGGEELAQLERLERMAASLGLGSRVRFLGQRDDVARLVQAADVYCQPNIAADAFGIAIVEAMYAGLPVITSRLGGPAELVDAASGVLVTPGDVDALAGAIAALLDDPARRRLLGEWGPRRAAEVADPVTQSRALVDALRELTGAAPC